MHKVYSSLSKNCDKIGYFCINDIFEHGEDNFYRLCSPNVRKFCWSDNEKNKIKNTIHLKQIYNFLKISSINEASDFVFSKTSFVLNKEKISNIIKSYHDIDKNILNVFTPESLIPDKIVKEFLQSENELLEELIAFIEENYPNSCNDIFDFFENKSYVDLVYQFNFWMKTKNGFEFVDLDYGANFRFKSVHKSLNLFNMKKEDRHIVIPQDDNSFIYALDFRQFEFRTFLSLSENNEYSLNDFELYDNIKNKTQCEKTQIIAYLYGQYNLKLSEIFPRSKILDKINSENVYFYNGYPVIISNEDKPGQIVHTIVQTISYYKLYEKIDKINKILKNKKSKFLYPIYDCFVFSINKDELELVDGIKNILEDNVYKTRSYFGNDLYNIKEMNHE